MIIPAATNNALQAGSGVGGNTYENILTDSKILITFESREVVIDKQSFEIIIEHCEC